MNDHFVIFDHMQADGSLLRMSPAEAYEYALLENYPKPQTLDEYEFDRCRAIRRFAKDSLFGLDRARFLSLASVSVKEQPHPRPLSPASKPYPVPEPTDLILDSDFE